MCLNIVEPVAELLYARVTTCLEVRILMQHNALPR